MSLPLCFELRRRQSSLPLFDDMDAQQIVRIERTWERERYLRQAAGFHPSRSCEAVLCEFTNSYPSKDWTGDKLDAFLIEYIARGIRAARAESAAKAAQRMAEPPQQPVYFGKRGRFQSR